MKKLVGIFKQLTAYDHFTVFLLILSVLKIADVFIDGGLDEGLHFLKLGVALFVISTILFYAFNYAFKKKKKYQHALISTFLILLVLSHADPEPVRGVMVIVFVYISKFLITYKGRTVFNPIALGIGLVTLISFAVPFIDLPPLDWSGIDIRYNIAGVAFPIAIVPILLSLYFNVGRIKKHPLALAFILTSLGAGFLVGAYTDNMFNYILSVLFIGTAIIVEPKTSPMLKNDQIYYGIGVALVIGLLHSIKVPNAEVLGILAGNVFLVAQKETRLKATKSAVA